MNNLTPGSNLCHCAACGLDFKSVNAFDSHRRGKYPDRRCMTPEELTAKGFEPNDKGFWRQPRPEKPTT